MAFNGYLIKVGGSNGTIFPMKYIKHDGYDITPNQRMESKAERSVSGYLSRQTVEHTASKIEFNTRTITNTEVGEIMSLISSYFTDAQQRQLPLEYYEMETDSYKESQFYVPDIKFHIKSIDLRTNTIYYDETRIAFIEY